jgi:pimeloyl-ACP methyl ester carboxylesterase
VVLGHGIGGSIALELATQRPDVMRALILHAPVGAKLDRRLIPRVMRLPGASRAVQHTIGARMTRPILRRVLDGDVPRAASDRFLDDYAASAAFGQMFHIITAEWFAALKPHDVPTVLLWGRRDRTVTVDQLDEFRPLCRTLSTRVVDHWGHFPMVDHPDEYAAEIASLARRF